MASSRERGFPFRDFDPAELAKGRSLAEPAAGQEKPDCRQDPDPTTITTAQLLAYIRRQYRLGELRQERLDEERRRALRAARLRGESGAP